LSGVSGTSTKRTNPPNPAPTILGLFDLWIEREPDGAYAQPLEFDERGFPTVINLDLDPDVADEEVIVTIDSFTPLP
jgi:hypothetical protein